MFLKQVLFNSNDQPLGLALRVDRIYQYDLYAVKLVLSHYKEVVVQRLEFHNPKGTWDFYLVFQMSEKLFEV